LGTWAILASYYAVKFGLILLRVQDTLEESLDILDERYHKMGQVLDIPLYSDSPEIRRIRDDIVASQAAVLTIASKLTKDFKDEDKEELVEER
jgi:hypothetical protein